jgi:hypothetical protein
MQFRILSALVNLYETVTINSESLSAAREGLEEKAKEKLKESRDHLEMFREEFHAVANEVSTSLLEK